MFRYLACEAFLPGYNFTRLPVRVFVANNGEKGEYGDYISRPRLIALREYGPRNIIYYSGQKYRVNQMISTNISSQVEEARICTVSGFWLDKAYKNHDVCPFSNADLTLKRNRDSLIPLIALTEQRAERTEYITCEEEERRRLGYSIETYFSVKPDELCRVRRAHLKSAEDVLLNLSFIPAAQLIQ